MIDFELRKQMECTEADKEKCLPVIDKILEIASIARSQGILSLEELIPEIENYLIKVGIQLMVDGLSEEYTLEVLDKMITASYKTGAELMQQLIIRDGLLAIQAGESPRLIILKLYAYLGEEYVNRLIGGVGESEDENEEQHDNRFKFEDLASLAPACLQKVLQNSHHKYIAIALSSAADNIKEHVFSNLSKRNAQDIKDDIERMGALRKVDVEEAQNKILETVRILQETGAILIEHKDDELEAWRSMAAMD